MRDHSCHGQDVSLRVQITVSICEEHLQMSSMSSTKDMVAEKSERLRFLLYFIDGG